MTGKTKTNREIGEGSAAASPTRLSPHSSDRSDSSPASSPTRPLAGKFLPPESPTSIVDFQPREETAKQSDTRESDNTSEHYPNQDDDAFFIYEDDDEDADEEVANLTQDIRGFTYECRDIEIPGLEHLSEDGIFGLECHSSFRRIPPKNEFFMSFDEDDVQAKAEEDGLVGLAFLGE